MKYGHTNLRLPGHGEHGPTLEIFTYASTEASSPYRPDQTGFGHIAFQVANVRAVHDSVMAHGGSPVGAIVRTEIPDAGPIEWAYVRDPEGNVVEIQHWE